MTEMGELAEYDERNHCPDCNGKLGDFVTEFGKRPMSMGQCKECSKVWKATGGKYRRV